MDVDAARELAREAKRRAEKATPGPWYWEGPSDEDFPQGENSLLTSGQKTEHGYDGCVVYGWGYDAHGVDVGDEDATFIAHARSDVPALCATLTAALDALSRKEEEAAKLRWMAETIDEKSRKALEHNWRILRGR